MAEVPTKFIPGIIAMKGLPSTGKSYWAGILAQFLECPLLKLDDILSELYANTKVSSPDAQSAVMQNLETISFESMCKAALGLLKLSFKVVIDSSLSDPAHLRRLLRLSEATGAPAVIVECRPNNVYQWESRVERWTSDANDDVKRYPYKKLSLDDVHRLRQQLEDHPEPEGLPKAVGEVTSLLVDTTATVENYLMHFAVEELLSSTDVRREKLPGWVPERLKRKESEEQGESTNQYPSVEHEEQIYTKYIIFNCSYDWREEGDDAKVCGKCSEPISGFIYNCNQYKMLLHKSCAESPPNLTISPREEPPYLRLVTADVVPESEDQTQYRYSFPETARCNRCNYFRNGCTGCLFQSHIRSASLPTVLIHDCHPHLLVFRIDSLEEGMQHFTTFDCDACGEIGRGMWYFCDECNFKCHVKCALTPSTVKNRHHSHLLRRQPSPSHHNHEEVVCDACEYKRNPNHWIYYCQECEFACHLNCSTLLG